jgi:hypothetical protein
MRLLLVIAASLFLVGCKTVVPVTPNFPNAPTVLRQQCEALKEATEGMSLTEFTRVVVENYLKYHECAARVEGWNEWYTEQKRIFEEASKR